jgi:hypothetical protein
MTWHSASVPCAGDPPSADKFQPAVRKVVPVRAGQCAVQEASPTACLCQPEMPFDAGFVHLRAGSASQYGQILLPWRCHEDQEGLTAFGDQASDLGLLGSGGGI